MGHFFFLPKGDRGRPGFSYPGPRGPQVCIPCPAQTDVPPRKPVLVEVDVGAEKPGRGGKEEEKRSGSQNRGALKGGDVGLNTRTEPGCISISLVAEVLGTPASTVVMGG